MNELKPCPFCGTIPEIQICDRDGMIYPGSDYEENPWNGSGYRLVRSIGYPYNYDVVGSDIYNTPEEAEEAWNKIVQKVDVMEKNLDLIIAIAIDYDGYRTVTGLMALIDELADLAAMALRGETLQDMTYEDLIAAEMESERTEKGEKHETNLV